MSRFADVLDFVAKFGRNGDTELAHVNPQEKAVLKAMGGSGSTNPTTGLREYFMDSGSPAGDTGGFMGDTSTAASFGGPQGGYLESVSSPTPASTPSAFDFVGRLENPQTAGPALVGALAGPMFGGLATLGQAINDRYYGGEARAFGGTKSTGEFQPGVGPEGGVSNPDGAPQTMAGLMPGTYQLAGTPYYPGDLGLQRRMYSYAEGGQVGPGGVPQRPGLAPRGQAPNAQMLLAEAQRFAQQNPQQVQQIQAAVQDELQSGDMNMQQITALVKMAMVALQQPDMYPQLRAAAIKQGLIEEDDLSPQFDQATLFVILLVGQSLGAIGGQPGQVPVGEQAPQMQGRGQVMPSMARGGALPARSPNPDGSIGIKAHEGEYVVPAHVVRAKGTEFFDKLVGNYSENR